MLYWHIAFYKMPLDIFYKYLIQNQKSYIENMLFIILTYHEINRNSIFAPLHLNLTGSDCSLRTQQQASRCTDIKHSAPYRPGRLGISMPSA